MSDEIRQLLTDAGLPSAGIQRAPGFANVVAMTGDHVIRLNEGRFVDAFRHEAEVLGQLKGIIPVPEVVAFGERAGGGEFIILQRLPGENLEDAWPSLSPASRTSIIDELASILRTLHAIPQQSWMRCRWSELANETGDAHNAYHAPPTVAPALNESATTIRPEIGDLLEKAKQFIADRAALFSGDDDVFLHTDIHFRNVIVDQGRITGLIDFEGSRPGPIDIECNMLIRWISSRRDHAQGTYRTILADLDRAYPQLLTVPHLATRLEVRELIWMLVQLHHWRPGATWMDDPATAIREVLVGDFRSRINLALT
jgi:aminoglycoside phosphotransferase (APT) family kinase protein